MPTAHHDGYLTTPLGGKAPGVLVLHAWWGLNETMKAFCDRLAESGFVAFAPDLYHGRVAEDVPRAESLSSALFEDLDKARADLTEATAFLTAQTGQDGRGLAVIGFSLGAFFALELSVTAPESIRSVVIFYGTRPGDYSSSKAAYLGHFAEVDELEPPANVESLEETLRRAGRPVTFHNYPGTGHWFFEPDRSQSFDRAAASLAWERTLAFLRAPAGG